MGHHTVEWRRATGGWTGWSWQRWRDEQVWGFDDLHGSLGSMGVRSAGKRATLFVAPDGTEHDSMRELFASFRMRWCDCERRTDPVEQLRSVLSYMAHGVHNDLDAFIDLAFEGQAGWMESYVDWMEREQLVGCIGMTIADVDLSMEGAAIRRMLDMTAPGTNHDIAPRAALERFDRLYPGRRLGSR
jgi:hypothetical protein